jgi:hypothetical protein
VWPVGSAAVGASVASRRPGPSFACSAGPASRAVVLVVTMRGAGRSRQYVNKEIVQDRPQHWWMLGLGLFVRVLVARPWRRAPRATGGRRSLRVPAFRQGSAPAGAAPCDVTSRRVRPRPGRRSARTRPAAGRRRVLHTGALALGGDRAFGNDDYARLHRLGRPAMPGTGDAIRSWGGYTRCYAR